mmetsp:Transcript_35784/g.70475  ORF Transcript_35784/g.70475 Transcript_35784/m.70475 type:complete len:230 (+) Transcript_35784:1480-2169(+)
MLLVSGGPCRCLCRRPLTHPQTISLSLQMHLSIFASFPPPHPFPAQMPPADPPPARCTAQMHLPQPTQPQLHRRLSPPVAASPGFHLQFQQATSASGQSRGPPRLCRLLSPHPPMPLQFCHRQLTRMPLQHQQPPPQQPQAALERGEDPGKQKRKRPPSPLHPLQSLPLAQSDRTSRQCLPSIEKPCAWIREKASCLRRNRRLRGREGRTTAASAGSCHLHGLRLLMWL